MKKYLSQFILFLFIMPLFIDAQIFFQENFNYLNIQGFKDASDLNNRWSYFHFENQDFNDNGTIDSYPFISNFRFENIKSTTIMQNFGNGDLRSIRFSLQKMDTILVKEFLNNNDNDNTFGGDSSSYSEGEFYNYITRNEIATWDDPNLTFKPEQEYWFSYDIFIPQIGFEFEKQNCSNQNKLNYELVGQWHLTNNPLITFKKPPLSLQIHCDNWVVSQNPIGDDENGVVNHVISQVQKGVWVNWKFNVIFSNATNKGKIKVYKDGNLVVSITDTKTLPVNFPVYFKLGVYKAHWWSRDSDVYSRTLYYDNVKIYKTIGLIDADCNKQLTASDMEITTQTIDGPPPSEPGYHFRIDSNAQGSNPATSNHVYSTNPTIDLNKFSWVLPNTTYFVKVMIDDHPIYYNYPEENCKIYTPDKIHIGLIEQDCGRELTDSNRIITCETVLGDNVMYHFRIDSNATGTSPATSNHINSPTPTINLANYSWFKPNRTYYVKVRIDNRPMYEEYAEEPCEIIWNSDFSIGSNEKSQEQILQVFPNPIKGNVFNVQLQNGEEIKTARLISLKNGEEFYCTTNKDEIKVGSNKFENGIYSLILITNKGNYEFKIIKK